MRKGSLRGEMPLTAAFIDSLREAFGADSIDAQIRRGMRGEPVFYASENGHEIGTAPQDFDRTASIRSSNGKDQVGR